MFGDALWPCSCAAIADPIRHIPSPDQTKLQRPPGAEGAALPFPIQKPHRLLSAFAVLKVAVCVPHVRDRIPAFTTRNSMNDFLASAFSLMLIVSSSTAQESSPTKIPLEDFFRNPETTAYDLSPSGELIGYLKPVDNRLNVFVQKKSGGQATQVTHVKDRDLHGFFWKGEKYLIYLKDSSGDENYHVFVARSDGTSERDITPFEGVKAEIIDDLEDHPTDLIVGLNKRNKEVFDAYRLNVETGELKLIAENPGNISVWKTDHDGNLRVATSTDGVNTSLLYRKTEQDPWKSILTTNFKEVFSPQFFTFDNKNLYGASNIGRDKTAIVEFDLDDAKETRVIFDTNASTCRSNISFTCSSKESGTPTGACGSALASPLALYFSIF